MSICTFKASGGANSSSLLICKPDGTCLIFYEYRFELVGDFYQIAKLTKHKPHILVRMVVEIQIPCQQRLFVSINFNSSVVYCMIKKPCFGFFIMWFIHHPMLEESRENNSIHYVLMHLLHLVFAGVSSKIR